MVFSSILFLFRYLPIVLFIYYISPRKYRNALLFFVSLIFYAWGEPIYVSIMIFSTLLDYVNGRLIGYFKERGEWNKAKLALWCSIIINLGMLGFFKYMDFLIQNINYIFGLHIGALNLSLPIGISFYTFQTMSYTIDVYRGDAKVQKNFLSFGAFVALFPQLIAGPIVQYNTISEQLDHRKETLDQFSYGILRFIIGLGKKVLLANNIGLLWSQISEQAVGDLPIVTAWIGIIAFAFQIYFDFSGYSDMAIGLGQMFGFRFLENFNYPYESKSITEFWRRWHISLGSWFRDYVYIPLGGNRKGLKIHIRNIAIVWLLTGIWHGASWNFITWGVYFGIILVIEKFFLLKWLKKVPSIVSRCYTCFIVLISWVIFAFDNFKNGLYYLKVMFGLEGNVFVNNTSIYYLYTNAILFLLVIIGSTHLPKKWVGKILGNGFVVQNKISITIIKNVFLIGVFLLSVAYLVDASYNPFLYFRF